MKKITALLLFTMVILSHQAIIDPTYDFSKFVIQFNKNYNPKEYVIRKQIFDSNYAAYIKQLKSGKDVTITSNLDYDRQTINNYYNSLINSGFSATINNYYNFMINSGFSATIYNYYNFMINSGFSYSKRSLKSTLNLFPTPKQFDWRALGRVSPVKNQNLNYCGSCWAFVSTAQYESALAIATNGIIYDLSEQYALECDTGSNGCSYGYFDKALSLFNQTGVPLQQTYPYKGESSYYKSRGQPICNSENNVKLPYAVEDILMYDANSIQQIQQDLVEYGPMAVGVYGSGIDFANAGPSGLISCAYAPAINHAVLLVGYNTSHWFVKNSWGTQWGHNGYGYILKTADCGLSKFVLQMRLSKPSSSVPSGPVISTETLTIEMTDSAGDGWQGTIIALQQKNIIIGTFGSQFLKGSTLGPIKLTIPATQFTKVVVYQIGEFTNQVGFKIKNSRDQLVYQRQPGVNFTAQIAFTSFCPLGECSVVSKSKYYIGLQSKCGDWDKNVLGLRQNGVIISNLSLTNSKQADVIQVELQKGKKAQIIVQVFGSKTENIQIKIRSQTGAIIAERLAGTSYGANQILLSWEPGMANEGIVFTGGSNALKFEQTVVPQNTATTGGVKNQGNEGLVISTIVLSITTAIFLVGFLISCFKLRKANKAESKEQPQSNQSEDRIQKETI